MQSGGMLLFYQLQQCMVQYNMQQALNSRETKFEKLTLSLHDYAESKIEDDEIFYNGKMYDVKSATVLNDHVELLAINDLEEEDVLEKIKRLLKHDKNKKTQIPGYLISLSSLDYLPPGSDQNFIFSETGQNNFQPFREIIISYSPEITSPPPKFA